MPVWNGSFAANPQGTDKLYLGDNVIVELKAAIYERLAHELHMNIASGNPTEDGWLHSGASKVYFQSAAPDMRPDGTTSLTSDDNGRIWISSIDGKLRYYNHGAGSTPATRWIVQNDNFPVGTIDMFAGEVSSIPTGWVLCNGQTLSRTDYASLNSIMKDVGGVNAYGWGAGDGSTTFNVPDLRGVYVRGAGANGYYLTLDPAFKKAGGGVYDGGSLTSRILDRLFRHIHFSGNGLSGTGSGIYGDVTTDIPGLATSKIGQSVGAPSYQSKTSGTKNDGVGGSPRDGDETTVASISINFIIKARNVDANYSSETADIDSRLSLLQTTEILSTDTIITHFGSYRAVASIKITLPASLNVGEYVELYTEQACRIVQADAESVISWKNQLFTTPGVYVSTPGAETGYLQTRPGDYIKLVYEGDGWATAIPPTKLSLPTTPPAFGIKGIDVSQDGKFVAMSVFATDVMIYTRSGDTLTYITTLTTPGPARRVRFSPDGNYLAVGHDTSPFISIYKYSGTTTFTKLANPASLPGGPIQGVDWSPDSKLLALASTITPFIIAYSRSGDTFTKATDPTIIPSAGEARAIKFTNSGDRVLLGGQISGAGTGYVYMYSAFASQFAQAAALASLPDTVEEISIHNNDSYAVISYTGFTNNCTLLSVGPGSLSAITGSGGSAAFNNTPPYRAAIYSYGSKLLVGTRNVSPFIYIYDVIGRIYRKRADPTSLPSGYSTEFAWSPSNIHLYCGGGTSPYLEIYKMCTPKSKAWSVDEFEMNDATDMFDANRFR